MTATLQRMDLAQRILDCLENAVGGSTAALRGSLGEGRADAYSDIDVLWEIPDERWDVVEAVGDVLSAVQAVESLRSDPDLQCSRKHRLLFVRFADVPLFWRLDLEICARSIGRDHTYDLDQPSARGRDWSWTESALANVVAAIKAHLRADDDEGIKLLDRAAQRVGLAVEDKSIEERVWRLVDAIARSDPQQRAFAERVGLLAAAAFEQTNPLRSCRRECS